MKQGTLYASKLKRAYRKWRSSSPITSKIPEKDDPIRRLAVAIFGVGSGDAAGERAVEHLLAAMVDWNEVRVSSPLELHGIVGKSIPQAYSRCQRLIRALQVIYDRENRLSLDRLKSVGRREARQYLEEIDGLDEYAVASIVLWALGGHTIPVSDRLLQALKEANLVHPEADRGEVQAFLERHISAADAKEFCLVMVSFKGKLRRTGKTSDVRTRKAKKKPKSRATSDR